MDQFPGGRPAEHAFKCWPNNSLDKIGTDPELNPISSVTAERIVTFFRYGDIVITRGSIITNGSSVPSGVDIDLVIEQNIVMAKLVVVGSGSLAEAHLWLAGNFRTGLLSVPTPQVGAYSVELAGSPTIVIDSNGNLWTMGSLYIQGRERWTPGDWRDYGHEE